MGLERRLSAIPGTRVSWDSEQSPRKVVYDSQIFCAVQDGRADLLLVRDIRLALCHCLTMCCAHCEWVVLNKITKDSWFRLVKLENSNSGQSIVKRKSPRPESCRHSTENHYAQAAGFTQTHDRAPLRRLLARIIVARRRLKMWGRFPSVDYACSMMRWDPSAAPSLCFGNRSSVDIGF